MVAKDEVLEGEDKLLVEIFLVQGDRTPVEELVYVVGNTDRWRDRLDVRVTHAEGWPLAETPYGTFRENFIVVGGKHVVHGTDYWALDRALEDAAETMAV